MKKLILGQQFIDAMMDAVDTKSAMTSSTKKKYLMRAAMSGIVVLLAYIGYININANYHVTHELAITSGKFISSAFFTLALITIYYTKSELLTSNMMITTVGYYYKKITLKQVFSIMGLCYLGNFLGGLFFSIILVMSTVVSSGPTEDYLIELIGIKQNYVIDGNYLDLFIRAVLCNFFINISMLMVYSGNIKDDFGKALAMFFGVFMFCYLGLEHSVANTVLFTFGYLYELVHGVDVINVGASIINVIFALVGNFVGGGILIGLYYAFINDGRKLEK